MVGGSPGCADGVNDDQLQLSPPLMTSVAELETAVGILAEAVEAFVPLELRMSRACVPSGSVSKVGLKLKVNVLHAV